MKGSDDSSDFLLIAGTLFLAGIIPICFWLDSKTMTLMDAIALSIVLVGLSGFAMLCSDGP